MKRILILIFVLAGSVYAAFNTEKVLNITKSMNPIEIDGIIEPVWFQSDSISDFMQRMPYHGKEPTKRTVARILTTEKSLYCLIVCYDQCENIQANKGKLDEINGDNVSLMLDTFNNQRTAYKFAVSASGVRSDCWLLDDARNRDYNWDGIWFADSKVYNWGYVVEIEVPYKSIQYDNSLTAWGLDIDRWISNNTEDIYWCNYEENEGQRISKFGRLIFGENRPTVRGMHLELYPVAMARTTYQQGGQYDTDPDIGMDVYYNPSPQLNLQLTANPDFAQIEADPFQFNISRYETYFSERRPFFTEGNEVFMAAGRQRNTGFYTPLELFYSRRIGKKLPDDSEVPLQFGTKTFGRLQEGEYGGLVAFTGEKKYIDEDEDEEEVLTEERAVFGSARIKKQILGNSSIGVLFVGKHTAEHDNGVIDIDGAFRTSNWQLAYQIARSIQDSKGDFAGSAGFTRFGEKYLLFMKGRYIGNNFDIDGVGYVPWKGTANFTGIGGPRWYFEKGYIRAIIVYGGPYLTYEKVDHYTDHGGILGFNMQFRNNWGYEINLDMGRARDEGVKYTSYTATLSSWFNVSPKWSLNVYGGYTKTYNFSREYLAFYSWMGSYFRWQLLRTLQIGTSYDMFVEGNPQGGVKEITFNARPFVSATPVNNLNIRIYVDNVWERSKGRVDELIGGFLFSYNFSPKSWIYFALNEVQMRPEERLKVQDRVAVFKLKYLQYF